MTIQKQSTKDKILDLLKKRPEVSVNQLANQLNLTQIAVRKQVNLLLKDGFIQYREEKQEMGRPVQLFSVSKKGERLFPRNYEGITVDFLNDIQELHGKEAIHYLFKKRELRLTESYNKRMTNKKPAEKILELAALQNEKGYMANVEQLADNTFEFVEYNCPIFEVAKQYKLACTCETEMFKKCIGDTAG
ncbi:helix-turn-helix transcriptional regulator [Paenibacillus gorillae]|uniref:helix-turn-helix transcriptional regulator n=1 Tax=Paenibacillus gorillae TaxID=1243662 RepID=UPI0004B4C16F|nr:winged helix-turn-helix transcriptional regulator [Paenibacillus gorillae]